MRTVFKTGLDNLNTQVYFLSDKAGLVMKEASRRRQIPLQKFRGDLNQVAKQNQVPANLIQNVSDAVISTDLDFNIMTWNKAAEIIYGWREDEVIGKPIVDVTKLEYPYDLMEDVLRQLFKRGYWKGEVIQKHRDGTPLNIYASVSLLKDESGNPMGAVAINHDRTELKQTEELHRTLVNSSPTAIYIVQEGKFVFFNPQFQRYAGFRKDELLAMESLGLVHPEDRGLVRENVVRMLKGQRSFPFSFRFTNKSGQTKWALGRVSSVNYRGKRATLGNFIDITERRRMEEALRQSEERFRSLAECAIDAIISIDSHTNIIFWNKAAETLFGYTADEVVGKSISIIMPERYRKELQDGINQLFLASKSDIIGQVMEVVALRRDGTEFPVELSWAAWEIGEGVFFTAIVRDVTERKHAQAQLFAYQKELRSLASELSLAEERERRRIAMEVHDRIGQTLASCRMKLGALIASAPPIPFAKPIGELEALIKQLIEDTRSLTFELSDPVLYEFGLEAALQRLTEQTREKHGILCDFEDDGQPKPLDNDVRILLFQTVRELLANVVKHGQARHTRVCINRHHREMRIMVEDDGVGFDTSGMSNGRKNTKGFGLFSIHERLHHIGGQIEIESEAGRGTRVTIVAPLKHE